MSLKNLTIITSVIKTINERLVNNCIRSVFTHEERYVHTINTIISVRKYSTDTYIVLVEASKIPLEWEDNLKSMVDYYYNVSNDIICTNAVNSQSKGLGEATLLLSYLKSDHFKNIKDTIDLVTKFSGRYLMLDNFLNVNELINNNKEKDRIIVNIRENNTMIVTIWFCLGMEELYDFIKALEYSYNIPDYVNGNISIESYLYSYWVKYKKCINVSYIGVTGLGATYIGHPNVL